MKLSEFAADGSTTPDQPDWSTLPNINADYNSAATAAIDFTTSAAGSGVLAPTVPSAQPVPFRAAAPATDSSMFYGIPTPLAVLLGLGAAGILYLLLIKE